MQTSRFLVSGTLNKHKAAILRSLVNKTSCSHSYNLSLFSFFFFSFYIASFLFATLFPIPYFSLSLSQSTGRCLGVEVELSLFYGKSSFKVLLKTKALVWMGANRTGLNVICANKFSSWTTEIILHLVPGQMGCSFLSGKDILSDIEGRFIFGVISAGEKKNANAKMASKSMKREWWRF